MMQFISKAVVWALCLVYSAFAAFRLFLLYVTKFPSKPWKPKDRPNPPACLSDPIYGTHKYAKVNVSVYFYFKKKVRFLVDCCCCLNCIVLSCNEHVLYKSHELRFSFMHFFFRLRMVGRTRMQGIRLHYVEAGDHSKPLMVLVHGFPEFWFSWRHQIVEFSKDYWFVAS